MFVSVGLTTVGAFLIQYPKLNFPSIASPFLLTSTSIAISRVIFSIHSLAEKLGSDDKWLLNHAQLSRVAWRRGSREGELIVEHDTPSEDHDEENDHSSKESFFMKPMSDRMVMTSCVGVHEEPWYGKPMEERLW